MAVEPEIGNAISRAIVQVNAQMDGSGVSQATLDIAKAVAARGWRSIIISGDGPLVRDALIAGVEHLELPTGARAGRRLGAMLVENNAALLHLRNESLAQMASRAASAASIPMFATHSRLSVPDGFNARRARKALLQADALIAISQPVADELIDADDTVANRISLIPRGIDMARFNPAAVKAHRLIDLATKLTLPDGVPVLIMPGAPTPDHGHEVLLQALARLGEREFLCLLPGVERTDGTVPKAFGKLVTDARLEGRVRFLPHLADMPAAYMLADLVISASIEPEGFGRTSVEGLAMGRPVVAFAHGGPVDVIEHDINGWLTTPGDADAMAAAIADALDLDAAIRSPMAIAARASVEHRFSLDRMCDATLKLYQPLLTSV